MAKYYFIEVQTLMSTNNVGKYVASAAEAYNHHVVTMEGWKAIMTVLDCAHREAVKANPRCRKVFELRQTTFKDMDGQEYPYCSFKPEKDPESPAFNCRGIPVKGVLPVVAEVKGEDIEKVLENQTKSRDI